MSLLIQWTAGQRALELLKKSHLPLLISGGKGVAENIFLSPNYKLFGKVGNLVQGESSRCFMWIDS